MADDPEEQQVDPQGRLRDRLAALDGLHASGHLSDDEHQVARQMAISGAVEPAGGEAPPPAQPPTGKADSPGLPPPRADEQPRRLIPVLLGVLGAALAGLAVVLLITLTGGGGSSPEVASGDGPTRTVRVTKSLTALYVGSSAGRCFGPRSGASFTVNGSKRTTDFLNCGDDDPSRATGSYEFMELPDGTIKSFTALLAIDEGSYSAQRASTAQFTIRYGDTLLCQATVEWGAPYRCRRPNLDIPTSSGTLVIEQDVTPSSYSSTAGLWAGVVGGRISISEIRPG